MFLYCFFTLVYKCFSNQSFVCVRMTLNQKSNQKMLPGWTSKKSISLVKLVLILLFFRFFIFFWFFLKKIISYKFFYFWFLFLQKIDYYSKGSPYDFYEKGEKVSKTNDFKWLDFFFRFFKKNNFVFVWKIHWK